MKTCGIFCHHAWLTALTVAILLPINCWASRGVIVKAAEVVLDGSVVGSVNVGQTVSILGINDETSEILVSVAREGDQPLVGLVPGDSILDKSNIPDLPAGQSNANRTGQSSASTSGHPSSDNSDLFSSSKVWTADELSEFMRDNRDKFAEFKGKKIRLDGVVSSLRVKGRGENLQMEIGLQTPPAMPRIKLRMSPTYLMGQQFNEKFGFKRDVYGTEPTVSFRASRDAISGQAVWERTTTYTYGGNRSYQSKRKSQSEWLPVVTLDSKVTTLGVLSDNRFEIVLTDVEFAD